MEVWQPVEKQAGDLTEVTVLRDGELIVLTTTSFLEPAPAAGVDVRAGDLLVSFNGQPVSEWGEFQELAQSSPGEVVTIGLLRDGEPVEVTAVALPRHAALC